MFYHILTVTLPLTSARCVYLIAGLSFVYVAVAPLVSRWQGPPSFLNIGYWVGGGLLLIAVLLTSSEETNVDGNILALCGSAFVTGLSVYGIEKFIASGLGFRPILSAPVFVLLLISSLASLLFSVLIIVNARNRMNE